MNIVTPAANLCPCVRACVRELDIEKKRCMVTRVQNRAVQREMEKEMFEKTMCW